VPQPYLHIMWSRTWRWWKPLLGLLLFAVVYGVGAFVGVGVVFVALLPTGSGFVSGLASEDFTDWRVLPLTNVSLVVALPVLWLVRAAGHGMRIGWSSSGLPLGQPRRAAEPGKRRKVADPLVTVAPHQRGQERRTRRVAQRAEAGQQRGHEGKLPDGKYARRRGQRRRAGSFHQVTSGSDHPDNCPSYLIIRDKDKIVEAVPQYPLRQFERRPGCQPLRECFHSSAHEFLLAPRMMRGRRSF